MVRLQQLFGLVFLGMVSLSCLGAESDRSIPYLTRLLDQAQTITGTFTQLSLDASGTQLQESRGQMWLKRPGQLRWHTEPPLEQLLVSDGETVWLYDPDLEQVTVQPMDQRMTHTPALLLSGDISSISENFAVTHQSRAGGIMEFSLKPKAVDTLFDELTLTFHEGLIESMQLVDSVGQKTRILFADVRLNKPVPDDQFRFQAPPGVDVISQ